MSDITKQVETAISTHKAIVINTEADLKRYAEDVKQINKLIKEVKESFDPIVKKANEAVKEARDQRDKHLNPLESIKSRINAAIVQFNQDEINKQKALEAVNVAKAEENEDFLAKIEAQTPVDVKPISGMYFKDNWKAVVIDESLVPRQFLCVDMIKLNQYARMEKEKAEVPGVKFINDKTPVVR